MQQTPLTADQQKLAAQMVKYWTNFAKTGNPNTADTPVVWPNYLSGLDDVQSLVAPTPTHETASDPTHDLATVHQCAFWDQSLNLAAPPVINLGVPSLP